VNIREIAKRARVSHSTVSRVINQVDTVDPKLVRRVQAVIQEVGYRPNFQARALARGRSHTVGLIVSELSGGNPFFSEIILYFERAAIEQGYEVLVSFADTETHPDHVSVCAARMQERQVEGIAALTFGMEEQLANGSVGFPWFTLEPTTFSKKSVTYASIILLDSATRCATLPILATNALAT